ncbi:uncharacterized protein LOC132274132 [Cornus florida]|uniref:uncharacterized protein LOC132274132 n=1 Tax=Cornus florida TaxID=4283 RepID=UPI00289705A6|nr:uncharacterized protein LOC132274132 [Cornus florida]
MDISQEIDDYIRESIENSLGLSVSTSTLELKLQAFEEAQQRLRDQYLYLQARLNEKDEIIERARAESSMNAQALKKFVEENQKLAVECANLLSQCKRWEKECSLYDHDREALMDFGNEADERAKEAEIRVRELEEELRRLSEEVQFYKHQCQMQAVDTPMEGTSEEQILLQSLVATLVGKDDVEPTAHAFLEANSGVEVCQKLLKMWNNLRPSSQKVLAVAAEFKMLQKDKEHLRINLHRAEEEVKLLFEENNLMNEENKRLRRQLHKERQHSGSGGKHTSSTSAKGSKRKCSAQMSSSPVERKIDFSDVDSPRPPLSPLQHNSPESRFYKK